MSSLLPPRAFWAAIVLLVPPASEAADWPRWRGPANDGHAPKSTPALTSLPAEAATVWQVPAGEGLASPVVASGVVLAFDNQEGRETLRALTAATGAELWRADIDEPFSDTQGPTGPRNTPVIDGDRVYAVSCRGELQCRRLHDGSLVWRANYVKDFAAEFIGEKGSAPGASRHGNNGSPLVHGDHLLACVGGARDAGVVCFHKTTGEVVWKSTRDPAGYAPPVVAPIAGHLQVIAYTANGVVGLDRQSGTELWRYPVKTSFARHVTTPVVGGDRVLVSSHQAGLIALRIARDGDTWSAADAWRETDTAINFASPVAVGGHLYGVGPYRNLICVEIASGRQTWSRDGFFSTAAGNAHAGFIVFGQTILLLSDSGELVLLAASPAEYQELGRVQVGGQNWCNPAYAEGVVYLRDGLGKGGSAKSGHWRAVRIQPASGA